MPDDIQRKENLINFANTHPDAHTNGTVQLQRVTAVIHPVLECCS